MKLIDGLDKDSFEEYGFGSLLGNFLADAIGSKDEFENECLKDHKL